jgi:hypothetical protein
MLNEKELRVARNLYEKIFLEMVEDSKEFRNFAKGNPHPLRMKVEDWIYNIENEFVGKMTKEMSRLLACAQELDTFITTYIEENNL